MGRHRSAAPRTLARNPATLASTTCTEKSWGIEPIFQDVPVTRDGKSEVMKEYTWLKGDRVGKAK